MWFAMFFMRYLYSDIPLHNALHSFGLCDRFTVFKKRPNHISFHHSLQVYVLIYRSILRALGAKLFICCLNGSWECSNCLWCEWCLQEDVPCNSWDSGADQGGGHVPNGGGGICCGRSEPGWCFRSHQGEDACASAASLPWPVSGVEAENAAGSHGSLLPWCGIWVSHWLLPCHQSAGFWSSDQQEKNVFRFTGSDEAGEVEQ